MCGWCVQAHNRVGHVKLILHAGWRVRRRVEIKGREISVEMGKLFSQLKRCTAQVLWIGLVARELTLVAGQSKLEQLEYPAAALELETTEGLQEALEPLEVLR